MNREHAKGSSWMYRGQVERRVQQSEIEQHKQVGFVEGRIPGRTQSAEGKRSRRGVPKMRAGKLAKYGVTDAQVRQAKENGERWCGWHKRFEPSGNFHVGSKICRAASTERDSIQYAKHGVARRNHVSSDWYKTQLAKQNGHCGLCPATVGSVRNPRFCYDHDHSCCAGRWSCGKCLRGLLCNSCNYRVGQLEEVLRDWDWVMRAMGYMKRSF